MEQISLICLAIRQDDQKNLESMFDDDESLNIVFKQ